MNILMGLSGGIASTTLLARFLALNCNVATIGFNYTTTYNDAAFEIAKYYNVPFNMIDVTSPMSRFQSEIPVSSTENKEIQTANMLFISILAGIAESTGFDTISLGTQNCSRAFVSAMHLSTLFSSNKKIGLEIPYLGKAKADILHEGLCLEVPYNLTHTCLTDEPACGICENCIERIDLFRIAGIPDPLTCALPT